MAETLSARPFSSTTRQENAERLAQEEFDLLIIGGGITGVAIARDASLRGFHTALVEKGDFGSGTSSRSTRLIHGGIRYLEYREFKLVFDACSERRVMRKIAPRLARPLPFLYPLYRGQKPSPWKLRAGMVLNRAIAASNLASKTRPRTADTSTVTGAATAMKISQLRTVAW